MAYIFRYNKLKHIHLLATRGVGFEEMIGAIEQEGGLIDILDHPSENYPHQKIFIVYWDGYYYGVPCVPEGNNTYFMKTVIPNRKYKKQYS